MKFSNGQLLFALLFVIAFVIAMIWSYRKDKNHRDMHYDGVLKIGITILLIIAVFAGLTFWIHE